MNLNKNKIHPLWPILIGEYHNPSHQEIKNELIKFFDEYENKIKSSRKATENYNLFESQYDLHQIENKAFNILLNFIGQGFLDLTKNINQNYLKNLENENQKLEVKIKESWFIRYNKGGMVMPHDHANCSMSCVYYVNIGKDASLENGSTFFLRPYSRGSTHNDFGGLRYNDGGASLFKAEEGKLIIWPSFLIHGSKPYLGNENRVIVSANADVILKK